MKLTAHDIFALPHLHAFGFERAKELVLTGVSTDSRTIQRGDLFIALRGETFDGHNFITKAVEAGAAAIIADSKWVEQNQILFSSLNVPRLVVEDTVRTFGQLANAPAAPFHDSAGLDGLLNARAVVTVEDYPSASGLKQVTASVAWTGEHGRTIWKSITTLIGDKEAS